MSRRVNSSIRIYIIVLCICVSFGLLIIMFQNSSDRPHRSYVDIDTLRIARENFFHAIAQDLTAKWQTVSPEYTTESNTTPLPSLGHMFGVGTVPANRAGPILCRHTLLKPNVINSENVCRNSKVDILIYVQSLWTNLERRRALRETWANTGVFRDIVVKTVFILGRPDNPSQQIKINNEYLVHGDIVQGDFLDDFKNLTMKSLVMLRWVYENCAHARYVMKADDDVFVNIFLVVERIVASIWDKANVVACHVIENGTSPIIRETSSRWYVPSHVLPKATHFPRFCTGYAVFFTGDLIESLYSASFKAPFVTVDDVYVFGILMAAIPVVHSVNMRPNFTQQQELAKKEYTGTGTGPGSSSLSFIASVASGEDTMEEFWRTAIYKMTPWARQHASVIQVKDARTADVGEDTSR